MNSVKFIGMDVHKKTITIAIAEEGSRESARVYGTINNDFDALDKFCRKMVSTASQLNFVYEAGPCGYSIYHHLTQKGFDCIVAAPSMIPRKNGVIIQFLSLLPKHSLYANIFLLIHPPRYIPLKFPYLRKYLPTIIHQYFQKI